MKKFVFAMLVLLMGISAQAQGFTYLRFNTGSGTEKCVATDGLRIVFNNGQLVATSNGGNATIMLSSMNYMYFSNEGESSQGIVGDVNHDGSVDVRDISALINMIMAFTPEEESGDVNGDGRINVSDITALIDIIMHS